MIVSWAWVEMMSVGDQRWICRTKLRHRLVGDLWRHGILRRMSALPMKAGERRPARGRPAVAALSHRLDSSLVCACVSLDKLAGLAPELLCCAARVWRLPPGTHRAEGGSELLVTCLAVRRGGEAGRALSCPHTGESCAVYRRPNNHRYTPGQAQQPSLHPKPRPIAVATHHGTPNRPRAHATPTRSAPRLVIADESLTRPLSPLCRVRCLRVTPRRSSSARPCGVSASRCCTVSCAVPSVPSVPRRAWLLPLAPVTPVSPRASPTALVRYLTVALPRANHSRQALQPATPASARTPACLARVIVVPHTPACDSLCLPSAHPRLPRQSASHSHGRDLSTLYRPPCLARRLLSLTLLGRALGHPLRP